MKFQSTAKFITTVTLAIGIPFGTVNTAAAQDIALTTPQLTQQNLGEISNNAAIPDTIGQAHTLTHVHSMLEFTNFSELENDNLTFLAPRDSSFWEAENFTKLMTDAPYALDILKSHTIGQSISYDALLSEIKNSDTGYVFKVNLNGDKLSFSRDGKHINITDHLGQVAQITSPDIEQKNGYIHVVNQVLSSASNLQLDANS